MLNPTDAPVDVTLERRVPVRSALSVRLDEEPEEPGPLSARVVDAEAWCN